MAQALTAVTIFVRRSGLSPIGDNTINKDSLPIAKNETSYILFCVTVLHLVLILSISPASIDGVVFLHTKNRWMKCWSEISLASPRSEDRE